MSKSPKQPPKGKADRWNLGEPLKTDLLDFCDANFDSNESEVIRRALRAFIDHHYNSDDKMRARVDEARKKRAAGNVKLRSIEGGKD